MELGLLWEGLAVLDALAFGVDFVGLASVYHRGAPPLEMGGDVKDEVAHDVALLVDIAPDAVLLDGDEALGAVACGVVDDGDDNLTLLVYEAHFAVLLDEGEVFGEGVEVGEVAVVLILDGEDELASAVDDAEFAVALDHAVAVVDAASFIPEAEALDVRLALHHGELSPK